MDNDWVYVGDINRIDFMENEVCKLQYEIDMLPTENNCNRKIELLDKEIENKELERALYGGESKHVEQLSQPMSMHTVSVFTQQCGYLWTVYMKVLRFWGREMTLCCKNGKSRCGNTTTLREKTFFT